MAGGVPGGGYPTPVRRSGSSCLTWGLAGCGVLVLIIGIAFAIAVYRFWRSPTAKRFQAAYTEAASCADNLEAIRMALNKYTTDHKGKYPPALADLVPKYLPDKSALTCGAAAPGGTAGSVPMHLEYRPPKPDAPPDTPVVSFRGEEASVFTQKQTIYLRLLKDGRIVMDTVSMNRTEMRGRRESLSR
ncbi:MAG TPA: type II secretion system protein [Chthonomonadaceae bacterium]|nr:type II secretion system protein [Chthonomonadaceae bacterium]